MTVEYKVCTKCGESKPATAEFFYATKNNKAGVESACKVCYRTRSSVNTVKRGRVYLIWVGVILNLAAIIKHMEEKGLLFARSGRTQIYL